MRNINFRVENAELTLTCKMQVKVNFYTPWKYQKKKHTFFMFLGRIKGNTEPKWVKHYNIGESGII